MVGVSVFICRRDKKQLECTIKFVKNCLEGLTQAASLLVVKGMEEYKEAVCSVGSEKYNGMYAYG